MVIFTPLRWLSALLSDIEAELIRCVELVVDYISVRTETIKAGWVYVLTNPCLPGLVKIGQTGNTAERRAVQVTQEYGVPVPFGVASRHATPDREAVELHRMLEFR
jgi:hypothetical protein